MKDTVSSAVNTFITNPKKRLIGIALQVEFREPGPWNRLKGLFTETILTNVLKEAEFASVNVLYVSFGPIVNEG